MAIQYRPQHRKTGDTTWTDIATGTWISTTSVVDSNLVSAQSYDYQVIADNGQAESTSAIATQATLSATGESSEAMTITVLGSPTIIYASQTRGVASPTGPWDQVQLTSGGLVSINQTNTPSSGVVAIVYHSHTTYQENNTAEWWYWDTSLVPHGWSTNQFTITTSWTPVSYAANAAIGTVVGTVTTTMSDGETFTPGTNGALTLSDNTNFKLVGAQIQAKVVLSQASYPLTVTATPISAGVRYGPDATAANTITQTGTATRLMVFGVTNFSGGGQLTESPAFHTSLGYYPDMTGNRAGQNQDGSGGYDIYGNAGFPWVGATSFFEFTDTVFNDPNAAANNDSTYVAGWTRAAKAYAGTAGTTNRTYAVRMCREWTLTDWSFCPWYGLSDTASTPRVSAATWVAGFRNCVNVYRQFAPNVKICWDYPIGWQMNSRGYNQAQALAFYPGDAYVDIISCDIYFPDTTGLVFGDGTSADAWLYNFGAAVSGGYPAGFRFQDWAAFAANGFTGVSNGGKPIAVPEWADCYQDGYLVTKFLNWLKTPSTDAAITHLLNTTCVFHTYYDITLSNFGNPSDPALGRLQSSWAPNRYTNWVNFHKALATTYTGSFWPTYWTVPGTGTLPDGY